ncbi:FAD-dependent oxidoreductase [Microvirga vignae]|uniref:FAD-dependent oxidoreductase n=1 Tax=Microvirga vignae TaxID=1225564 RepID=A0A0H1R5G1_9HYPH|nr:FAD-dependent oxidoreductase [Microvirga vignae]KLK90465.1 FAD-dependent oxidoreductase [Microvirga vignae]
MTQNSKTVSEAEIAVIGGGLVGSATAYGLAQRGARVLVLDEGDIAYRASRGNFALVWVQSKGLGMSEYAAWTKTSAEQWSTLAKSLRDETDIDVAHHQPGGFMLCLSEAELEARINAMRRLHNQPRMVQYPYEILDHDETKRRLPAIGPDVVGSVFCPLDGHVNSLRLFRALHLAMARSGVSYRPNSHVESIKPDRDGFLIDGPWGQVRVQKVVLAAGLGNARLGPMVGLHAPVRPSKGQVIVTEKAAPFLHHPIVTVRQTDEGGVMIGDSQEDLGFDTVVTPPVISLMAQRAVRMFPLLAGLNVVRTWSALRVMSPDGFPIYDQSQSYPGAFVVTCHSGVTLAANHALTLAHHILEGTLPASLEAFSSRRFHVSSAA